MPYQLFISLLAKQFSGEITPDELQQLNEWLEDSREHQLIADDYRQVWNEVSEPNVTEIKPNVGLAFSKVLAQIEDQKESTFWRLSFGNIGRIAAAIAFLVLGVWGYKSFMPSVERMTVSAGQMDKKEIKLPDGSTVWLRKGAQISFPVTFGKEMRCVSLVGEAFFEVTSDPQRHFCVETKSGELLEVLGTSFNVKQSAEGTDLLVKTGKVRFSTSKTAADRNKIVTAGSIARHNTSSADIAVSKAVSFNDIAWQTGHLEFIDVPFKQAIADIETYFNIKIQVENAALFNCNYTSPKVSNDVQQALKSFCNTYQLDISNPSSNFYILKGGTCL